MKKKETIWSIFHPEFNQKKTDKVSSAQISSSVKVNTVPEIKNEAHSSTTEKETSLELAFKTACSSETVDCSSGIFTETNSSKNNDSFLYKGSHSEYKFDVCKPSCKESTRRKRFQKERYDNCSQLPNFQNSRAEIEEISDSCVKLFLEERKRIAEIYKDFQLRNTRIHSDTFNKHLENLELQHRKFGHKRIHSDVFNARLENLDLQHKEFEKFVSSTITQFTTNSAQNNCTYTESIIKTLHKEAAIFQCFFPAYGLRQKLLDEIEKNKVTVITADCAYLLNIALSLTLSNVDENHMVILCEENEILSEVLQKRIDSIFPPEDQTLCNLKVLSEEKFLKQISCSEFFSEMNSCIIYNVPLKRSLISDINLANLRDLLVLQKNSKLILLLSPYEDASKFRLYFSPNVTLLDFPSLCLPVKTVWKDAMSSPSNNFEEDVVNTVFAIHVLCEPGDIVAFLPSIEDVKSVYEELEVKIAYHQYIEIKVFSVDDNYNNFLNSRKIIPSERKVFLFTDGYEGLIIPSVRYVIDCGIHKEYSFDSEADNNILTPTFISKARAKERKNLAGVYNVTGICFRIYNKANYLQNMYLREHAEIFCLSPVHSMVKVFEHCSCDVEGIQFVESLPSDVQSNTVKALKAYGAIDEDSCLTHFGKQIIKLPFPIKYSRLILFGIRWGYAYEAVVLVAFFSTKTRLFIDSVDEEHQKLIDVIKLNFNQFDSDTLTYLNIFKIWKENNFKKIWCDKHYMNFTTLKGIRYKINELCHLIHGNIGEEIRQEFSDNTESNYLVQMLFECFQNNLCSYTGHYRTGYQVLATKQFALVHPSSFLFQKDYPRFIIYEDLSTSDNNYAINLTCIPFDIVMEYLHKGILNFNGPEMLQDQLEERVIDAVGEKVITQILLKNNGRKAREIEDNIKKETSAKVILLEPVLGKGCVKVYAFPNDIDKCVISVNNILGDYIQAMVKEEEFKVIKFEKGQNCVRFEIKWTKGAETISSEHTLVPLNLQPISDQNISSSAVTSSESMQTSINYSLKLVWPRRFCTGEGYLNLKNLNDFNQARRLAFRSFQVNEYDIFVQVSERKPNQLRLSDIPPEVTKEDLIKTFTNYLSCDFEIELCYLAPFKTSYSELMCMKKQIEENCRNDTNLRNFDVKISMPDPSSIYVNAYVNVFETRCLNKEASNLSVTKVNNMRLSCMPLYFSELKCSFTIFNALQYRIRKEFDMFNNECIKNHGKSSSFKAYPSTDDSVSIKLSSDDIQIIKSLQMKINDLLHGIVLDKNNVNNIHKLFCHGGHVHLKNLESTTNVFIMQNFETKTIRLYGEEENCNYVRQDICYFLKDTEEKEIMEKIILCNETQNRMVLKALIMQYGVNLEKFIELCGLRSAALDIRTSSLILYGKRENIEKAKECIKELSASSKSGDVICHNLSSEEICPVCSCVAENLTFRLEHCGHLYCSGCIEALIEQGNFPIQCCAENCSKDIILEDIKYLLNHDVEKIDELAEKSVKAYLEKNRDKIFYCPTADCSMFVYKNELKENKWSCPLCQNVICINCNVVYHEGYTCDMYKGSREDPDYSFKVWQSKNKECKLCPNCASAIEKRDGCNHMTCLVCKSHFCWICLKKFNSGNEVYGHIERAHPGLLFAH